MATIADGVKAVVRTLRPGERAMDIPDRVIGVDPDADRHGLSVFERGELKSLTTGRLSDVLELARAVPCLLSIEEVTANTFVYKRNDKGSRANVSKIAMAVGRCQQAQVELCRMLDQNQIPYVLHKPQSGNWAKNKALFEKVTGWTSRSNEDTRSAAYFGWLVARYQG